MGDEVDSQEFTRRDRQEYREKVHRCLDVLARMLSESRFDFERPLTGMEIELNLIDAMGNPAMRNDEVLEEIDDPDFQTELGRFNLEINVPPRPLAGTGVDALEADVRFQLNEANESAQERHAGLVMIGILPTLMPEHMTHESISANPRYRLLDEQLLTARGEDLHIDIEGVESLETWADTIAPEAACTSVQFHLQVGPDAFAEYWNAAQCLASVQVALGANSPYFMAKELWSETRIALFTQATDTRSAELKAQGVRPRVWFGERWITSVFDLYEENLRYFPSLLPVVDDEDPVEVLDSGGTPRLQELRLHNGTVWRWNRPVYDVVDDVPHLRVENRVLPAGPTVVDVLANGAFYYGTLRMLAEQDRPVWTRQSFATAEENFTRAATTGLDTELFWPGHGDVPVSELVLRHLLPMAHEGLARWGVDRHVSDRLLGIIEQRCITGQNGSSWQTAVVKRGEANGLSRIEALRTMTLRYVENMHTNEPVHTWSV